jgi:DNA-binding transcriptional MocR family regulator
MDWLPTITERSGPRYLKIVEALAGDISSGRLARGQRLPTHRALARSLGIDLTTVTRAYAEARRRGLIDARVGRGTFVSETTARAARDLPFEVPIDLSMNVPPQPLEAALEERIAHGLAALQDRFGFSAFLEYQPPGGSNVERAIAAKWISQRLSNVDPSRVVIFPGNQAIIFNVLMTATAPGDVVLTEALTFPGLIAAADKLKLRLIGVPLDAEGVIPAALEEACRKYRPKVIHLTPTHHNPTTATMSGRRRAEIAAVVRRTKSTLLEDDAYGALEPGIVPIAAKVPEHTYLAVGLAKCIAPMLRVSYLVAPNGSAAQSMQRALQATCLMPSPLLVALASHWLQAGIAPKIIQAIRNEARARQALARKHLKGVAYSAQLYSHHLWLPVPQHWRRADFLAHIRRHGVGAVSDDAFAVGDTTIPGVRICLGAARHRAELVQALQLLAITTESSGQHAQVV